MTSVDQQQEPCLECRLLSGGDFVAAGLYVCHHSKRYQKQVGKAVMYSSASEIQLRGIRNFDSEDALCFSCPLTLIFGLNGTGKTSIIEALKNKCVNDAEINIALGVSKSILNYVVFCPQNELNSSFDQNEMLKNIFDEIFDSAKFNKASESILKLQKELQDNIRTLKTEKQTLSVLVSEVEDKQNKLKEHKKSMDIAKEKINDIDKQIELVKQEIEEVQQFTTKYMNIQVEEGKTKMEISMHKDQYEKLKKNIKNIFEETTEELEEELENLKRKHEDNIRVLLNIQELGQMKLKDTVERLYQKLEEEKDAQIQAQQWKTVAFKLTARNMEYYIKKQLDELKNLKNLKKKFKKAQNNVMDSEKNLEALKAELNKKLLLYKNVINDIKLWDRCIDEIQQLKGAVNNLETQMTSTENWQKQEADRKSMSESVRRLHKILDEINSFVNSNVLEKFEAQKYEIQTYKNLLTKLVNEKNDIKQTISKLKEDIISQEIGKRELLDNITLRKIREKLEILKEQYKKFNSMDYKKKMIQLKNEKQALLQQVIFENQEELEREIKQYTHELEKEEYRLTSRNYTNKCIELVVQEDTIANLKTYNEVLNTTMIEYHEKHMSTVNKIIKKLWKHIYKGTDITSIEICTELKKGERSNRRNYNYKLVQTRHDGCKKDMKKHCSAGQEALASIIIRLALAETFCKNFGIFVLDEPTTNLDEENANNLADMLTKIVELRSRYQKNFQLIITSHNKKFLQKLADLNNHKQFYELYRKQNGMITVKSSAFNEGKSSDKEEKGPNRKRYSLDDNSGPPKKKYYFTE
ncbi:DNA repair protein RAD50-like isoform X2 [Monomorium pharaonis]|uniref:DNA repair protein RAD50-like isoform X2 n=1 Tax=Monomorium pharaonis TaxID=307658 RepID=UPI0017466D57|nr:DNA repair protein RAD50-like isoform X2 [Monomorium pharaonis]